MTSDRCNRTAEGRAFTLVEILVVVVILALIAGLVIPMVVDTDDLRATAAARMVATDLQYAQNIAITTQQNVTVAFDAGEGTYALSNASGALIHPMKKTAFTIDLKGEDGWERVELVSASFGGGATVTFDELGAPSSAGTVTVKAGGMIYQISVAAATGRVTVTTVEP